MHEQRIETRILLVDDHAVVLAGLRTVLADEPGVEIVGEARNGREALHMATELDPDLVLMDISLPGMSGIDATKRIRESVPSAQVVCLSLHMDHRIVDTAIKAGASGYILKDCAHEELVIAIRTVLSGKSYLSPTIVDRVLHSVRHGASEGGDQVDQPLTRREVEVLQRIADGLSTKELAYQLQVSVKTISTHREHIMDKLGIYSIAGLTKYAIQKGLTSLDPDS